MEGSAGWQALLIPSEIVSRRGLACVLAARAAS